MSERTNRGLSADPVIAASRRRLGTLPFALALGCCDIGEAKTADGWVALTTWGLNLPADRQEWFIRETRFHPIWMGADDGSCELILCSSHSGDAITQWLKDGLRLGENPKWEDVPQEGGE